MNEVSLSAEPLRATWQDYLEMCKPKVVALMLLTAIVGMLLASTSWLPLGTVIAASVGISFTAGSAAVINHLIDRHIDTMMLRTRNRPIAIGKISPKRAIAFAFCLGMSGLVLLICFVNPMTSFLSFLTLIGYAIIYTVYLKRATPQNIVIGGLAGAAPPLLGWTAITGQISAEPLLLVLIIFAWTPPHFWALAIYRYHDYEKANIPMLPVTHGIEFTKKSIVLYTFLLIAVTGMPFAIGMSSGFYLLGALLLGGRFLQWSIRLYKSNQRQVAMQTFRFSINYLMCLFVLLLIDHYCFLV